LVLKVVTLEIKSASKGLSTIISLNHLHKCLPYLKLDVQWVKDQMPVMLSKGSSTHFIDRGWRSRSPMVRSTKWVGGGGGGGRVIAARCCTQGTNQNSNKQWMHSTGVGGLTV